MRARERVRRLWELTRWQPPASWPPLIDSFYWPADLLPPEVLSGFGEVAARHPGHPVFMYVDSSSRVELLVMALDRRALPASELPRSIVVTIETGPGASSLDAIPTEFGVLLVRPAAAADGQWPEPRQADRDGVAGWHSETGWVLVGRGASGATTEAALGSFFGPEQFEQVLLTGLLTPYQAERLSGRRIVPPLAFDRTGAVGALARQAGRQDGPGGLRAAIAQALSADPSGPGSRYAAFLPAGLGRDESIAVIRTGSAPAIQRILPLTLTIAADVLGRPIILIGPDGSARQCMARTSPAS